MGIDIREMTPDDYEIVYDLWKATEGIGLSQADSREEIAHYLAFNRGLSYIALEEGGLVGAVLCGQDGRRGYLHHLAVRKSRRRKGVGRMLVDKCLEALKSAGIHKCHIFVFHANQDATVFWESIGWDIRKDIFIMSKNI